MEKEAKQPDKESQPTESLLFGSETSKHSRPSSSSEGRRPEETRHRGPVPFVRINDTGGKYAGCSCRMQASSSTGEFSDSSLGCNRDFRGILYPRRPCFRRQKKKLGRKLE